nr:hypothetical protein [uncultured Lichenicoccus sp.]
MPTDTADSRDSALRNTVSGCAKADAQTMMMVWPASTAPYALKKRSKVENTQAAPIQSESAR